MRDDERSRRDEEDAIRKWVLSTTESDKGEPSPYAKSVDVGLSPHETGFAALTLSCIAAIGRATATARRLVEASVSPNTRRAYAGALRRLDAWLDGRELDDVALAAYLAELHDAGRASSSASMAIAAACFRAKLAGEPIPAGERTRSERLRTLGRVSADVDICDPFKTPIYQLIAAEAAAMHGRRVLVSAIAKHFGVDHHTVDKALRWFRSR